MSTVSNSVRSALYKVLGVPLTRVIAVNLAMNDREGFTTFKRELEALLKPLDDNTEFSITRIQMGLGERLMVSVQIEALRTDANEKILTGIKDEIRKKIGN